MIRKIGMNLPQLSDIQEARQLISKYLHRTPVLQSSCLDDLLGSTNYLKAEIFQKTGSFKPRGALNKILHLSDQEKAKGVIAVSLGNHAQAVAWSAKTTKIAATIVMPTTAQTVKVAATKGYGAEVILYGTSSIEAFKEIDRLAAERQLTFIHPFNDFHIMAGAGTIALEFLEQIKGIDNIFVSIGGGGLLAGVATVVKALCPHIKIIGVEPEGANSMYLSMQKGHAVKLESLNTIADVLAVPYAGELTYAVISKLVDQVLCVNDDDIKQAVRFLLERCKLVVEPGGATALAALLSGKYQTAPAAKNMIILSGGNVDLPLLATL
jgi:threonine dehydratase